MGNFLQKLGTFAFAHKWWVITVWVVILSGLGFVASQFYQPPSSAISIPGTQAQQTLDRFNELFPSAGASSGRIVLAAPDGQTVEVYKDEIDTLVNEVSQADEVTTVVSPFANPTAISEDKSVAYISVQLKPDSETINERTTEAVNQAIETARTNGLVAVAGGDLVAREMGEFLGIGEIGGVLIALLVLIITFGSLVAAGMPILTAVLTVGVSMAGLFGLSQVIDVNSTTPALAVMLGLAVGIDYSLFIVNRYRTFVHEGYSLKEAAGKALATAGSAVVFAAATVVIALASLAVVRIPFMTTMGLAAAATVALAAIVSITFVPAMLGVVGLHVFGGRARKAVKAIQAKHEVHETHISHRTIWYKWGEKLLKFRKTILLAALAVIVVLALPILSLTLGLPTDEFAAKDSSRRQAYDLMAEGFGAGYNGPLLLVVEGLPAVTDDDKLAVREQITAQYQRQMAAQLQAVSDPAQAAAMQQAAQATLEKQVEQYAPYYQLQQVAERVAKVENVEAALPILTADNGTKGAIQVTPKTGPSDQATKDLVAYLRDESHQSTLASGDVSFGVTGTTAVQNDINNKLAAALPVYLLVVVGLSFILLMIAFRSILIPIKATLGFLLSVMAMFGAMVAVFQWGWFGITDAPGPIVSFIPIIAIGILFGLAMDYEFFLVSGMQEAYHHNKNPRNAVLRGFALGSKVVVAAGLIMVAVFAGFITNHDSTIQSIGFALAIGILVDAFIVRLVIVPIVMSMLGKSAWWLPKWLDKILPKVSIEG